MRRKKQKNANTKRRKRKNNKNLHTKNFTEMFKAATSIHLRNSVSFKIIRSSMTM